MKKIFSADIGSGFTKAVSSLNEEDILSIQSIVTTKPEDDIFGLDEKDGVFFDGKKFLTGEKAKNFGDPTDRLNTINDDWHGTDRWVALLYQIIALSFDEDIKELQIITGLPQKIYSEKRVDLEKTLSRSHSFSVDGIDYKINIQIIIIPQAAGALIYNSYEDPSLLKEEIGVLDFGTHTTGLTVLDNGLFVGRKSSGISVGANELYKSVALHLKKNYAYIPDSANLAKIVRDKSFKFQREQIDISGIIEDSAMLVFQDVMVLINSIWNNNASDLRVFVTGGAGDIFYDSVKSAIPHAERSIASKDGSTFYDVAKGMFTYLQARN